MLKFTAMLLVSGMALLFSGCSTTKADKEFLSQFPQNTLVIRNHTPYYLSIWRNGDRWLAPGQHYSALAVKPDETLAIYNSSSNRHERVVLGLIATKGFRLGCLVGETTVWSRSWTVEAGTNRGPRLILAKGRDGVWGGRPDFQRR